VSSSHTSDIAIARRYATAMFSLAVDAGKEAALVSEIAALAAAVSANDDLHAALANPLLARSEKAAILTSLAAKADGLTIRALAEIAAGGRAALLPAIAKILEAELSAKRGELVAEITSARPLTAAMQQQLADALTKATGKNVKMQMKEDASVLGGVAVQLGSLRLDATLAGALNNLRNQLLAQPN